jgi:uncharacterized protein (TIGR03437 family)
MTRNMGLRFWAVTLAVSFTPTLGHTQSILSTLIGGAPNGLPGLSAALNVPSAIVTDSNGNSYVALKGAHQVVRIDSSDRVFSVAGNGISGSSGDGGPATLAALATPVGLALDQAGNLYIADSTSHKIRRVGPDGTISTFAGTGKPAFGGDGGPAVNASLYAPSAVACDTRGNVYIADTSNYVIRMVNPSGIISTIAGIGGVKGSSGNGGPALQAALYNPQGVLVDNSGNIFIADTGNNWIRVLSPNGTLSLYGGVDRSAIGSPFGGGGDPTVATNAILAGPTSMAMDQAGTLYFVEPFLYRVRAITAAGKIAPFAGTGTAGGSGDQGLASSANLNVQGVATDRSNNVLIADGSNNRVRIVTAVDGVINTLAGNGIASFSPHGLALNNGFLYFSDTNNNRIRRYNLNTQEISLVAGNGIASYAGDTASTDRPVNGGKVINGALGASINGPRAIAFDNSGNLFIADTGNNRIREVFATDQDMITVAGTGTASTSGDGGVAVNATLHTPGGVVVDGSGNVFISEQAGNVVREVNTNGVISTVAGTGTAGPPGAETGVALNQNLSGPQGLALDSTGALLIADSGNNRIRRLTSDGTITTIAGSATSGYSGDGGPATAATLRAPTGVQVDSAGNLYISDTSNYRIRKVDTNGIITTVAGNGSAGYNGDGSPATAYSLNGPSALVSTSPCAVQIADSSNLRIRQLTAGVNYTISTNPAGLQATVAGQTGTAPFSVALQPGTAYQVTAPSPQPGVAGVQYVLSGAQQVSASCGAGQTSVTVNFQTQYALSITSDAGGAVSPAAGFQNSGTSVTLTATPQSGYVFAGWEGDCTGTTCTLQMTGPKSVKADFAPSAALSPQLATGGVIGAGLSTPAVTALSPNGLAAAFGSGFAPAATLNVASASNLVNGALSTNLGGVCVLVGSTRAPILAVTPNQVNFQVPQGAASGNVSVQVVTACGTANPQQSSPQTVTAQSASPEFFYFLTSSSGQNPIAAVDASTGVYIGTAGLLPSGTFAPAKAGDIVTLYATGLGLTNPAYAAGQLPTAATSIAGTIQVTVGPTTLAASDVLYAGVAPGAAGLYQINLHLPASIPSGNQPVKITVNGIASPAGGYITVQ